MYKCGSSIIVFAFFVIIFIATFAQAFNTLSDKELEMLFCGTLTNMTVLNKDDINAKVSPSTEFESKKPCLMPVRSESEGIFSNMTRGTGISIGFYNMTFDIHINSLTYGDNP